MTKCILLCISTLGHVLITGHLFTSVLQDHLRANKQSLTQTLADFKLCASVNSFSAVYQGAQPKLFEECFRAKKKIPRHFKQHWRDGSSWSRAFKVTELCKRIQVHTTNTERDTSVTGVGPPWPHRPPHKHWSPLKPVSSWGLWSTGARRGPRCKCRFHTVMVAHLWSSFSHTVGIKARCGPNQAQPTSYSQQWAELVLF